MSDSNRSRFTSYVPHELRQFRPVPEHILGLRQEAYTAQADFFTAMATYFRSFRKELALDEQERLVATCRDLASNLERAMLALDTALSQLQPSAQRDAERERIAHVRALLRREIQRLSQAE